MRAILLRTAGVFLAALLSLTFFGALRSTATVQRGYPGVGMEQTYKLDQLADKAALNTLPAPFPAADQNGQLAVDAYKNVKVLGHLKSGEMTRLMTAITTWVAPEQGCVYCHAPARDKEGKIVTDDEGRPLADENKLDSDEVYAKRVARRMLEMTMYVNTNWQSHLQKTGVTCYTCHRGNPVPRNIWYDAAPGPSDSSLIGGRAQQNIAYAEAGLTSLPHAFFRPYLSQDEGIRVISTEPLPLDNRLSIKQTEYTYGLMMHMSQALGVNCTYCHNTRSMAEWTLSPQARGLAWYGIRMVRDLNNRFLEPLLPEYPAERLGPLGDAPKANCTTCHQGAFKPFLGASPLASYEVLAEAKPQPQKTVVPVDPNAPPAAPAAPGVPAAPAPAPAAPAAPAPAGK
jgi:photosynthetic reaction center cytochrome c subunit